MVLKLDCATLHLSLCWINTVIVNKTLCQCGSGLSVGRWLRALGRYLPKGAFQPLFGILKFTGELQKAPMAYGPVNIDWYFNYPSHNRIINHKHYSFTFPCCCTSGEALQDDSDERCDVFVQLTLIAYDTVKAFSSFCIVSIHHKWSPGRAVDGAKCPF